VIRALLTSFGFNAVASLFGGIATILVIAALSPQDWGVAASILSVGQLLGAAVSFGSQVERIRRYSRESESAIRILAGADSAGRLLLAIVLCFVAVIVVLISPVAASIIFTAAGVFLSLGTTNHLIASRRYVKAGAAQIAEKTIVLSIIGLVAMNGATNALTLAMATGIAGFVMSAGIFITLRPNMSSVVVGIRPSSIRAIWASSPFLGVASLAPSALLLDVALVLLITDSEQAGLFAVATKLTAPLSVAATAVVAVLLPHLSASSRRTLPRVGGRGLLALTGLIALLGGVFVSADVWVPLLFGNEYAEAVWPVRFYVVNVVIILGTRALVTILQAWNDERAASFLVLGQVASALLFISLGAHLAGAFGASIAVLVTNMILLAALLLRVRLLGRLA
jgi:O-antigen/teichoic acid export membrane protein